VGDILNPHYTIKAEKEEFPPSAKLEIYCMFHYTDGECLDYSRNRINYKFIVPSSYKTT
jgi:hypothetical protein